jgi:hypothetical protein
MFGGFVAGRAKQPLLALDDDEAGKISEAAANVGKHYDVPVSPVTQAWIGLAFTIGGIYSAKLAAIKMIREIERKEASHG